MIMEHWKGEKSGRSWGVRAILLLKVIFNLLNVFGLGLKNQVERGNLILRVKVSIFGVGEIVEI